MKGKGKRTGMVVSGNPNVLKEANEKKDGGRIVKRAKGGKVAKTKDVGFMTGGGVRPRLDRPGRKLGGRALANKAPLSTANKGFAFGGAADARPLSSAHKGGKGALGSSSPEDTGGGLRSD